MFLMGTITNQGNLAVNSVGNTTDLLLNGSVTLQGGGTVTLSNNANNRVYGGSTLIRMPTTPSVRARSALPTHPLITYWAERSWPTSAGR